jgi:hypothetical protein
MNVSSFLQHWSIADNPFRAEEARHDAVFARLGVGPAVHPDFDKICGEFDQPSTSIVFGEKGSGKTAIRLQIEQRLAEYNRDNPDAKCFFIAYDDLNPMLDRLCRSMKASSPAEAIRQLRLVDHMDAMLQIGVSSVVDALLGSEPDATTDLGANAVKRIRRADPETKRDLMLLQACYDTPSQAHARTGRLAATIGRRRLIGPAQVQFGSVFFSLICIGMLIAWSIIRDRDDATSWPVLLGGIAGGVIGIGLFAQWARMWWPLRRDGRALAHELRTMYRSGESMYRSLVRVRRADRLGATLPVEGGTDPRYEMYKRFRRVLRTFGFTSIMIIVDRVDEPSLVNGDVKIMRSICWPLFHSKFLQHEGVGVKLLLPLELKHELFRESTEFFQEARLDKQSLVERLAWSGAMLYDLCNTRLRACAAPAGTADGQPDDEAADEVSLKELFASDVTRQDIVDALDQMQQPRDAFKLLYNCIQEHCSNVTEEDAAWTIPRLVLESVRKQQSGRVQELHRGFRPA